MPWERGIQRCRHLFHQARPALFLYRNGANSYTSQAGTIGRSVLFCLLSHRKLSLGQDIISLFGLRKIIYAQVPIPASQLILQACSDSTV